MARGPQGEASWGLRLRVSCLQGLEVCPAAYGPAGRLELFLLLQRELPKEQAALLLFFEAGASHPLRLTPAAPKKSWAGSARAQPGWWERSAASFSKAQLLLVARLRPKKLFAGEGGRRCGSLLQRVAKQVSTGCRGWLVSRLCVSDSCFAFLVCVSIHPTAWTHSPPELCPWP